MKSLKPLESKMGVIFMGVDAVLLAMDTQPALLTQSNAGIPAYLSTYIDPTIINVLSAPMRAVEISGTSEKIVGNWTTDTAMFPLIEATGVTSSYGDYAEAGATGINVNYPQRQSYHYQVIAQWGERELERAGEARIDWANRVKLAAVLTLNKFQNQTYFFGVKQMQNYGLLNDPALSSAIAPIAKAAGGVSWENATANEVLADVAAIYKRLQTQSKGVIDRASKMVLAMSPNADATGLTKVSDYGVTVADRLNKLYPNMTISTAPEYSTEAGELVQLIADGPDGQPTVQCAFTEKLRAHPVVIGTSSYRQKLSQGTWGAVIYRPFLISQMVGV